MDQAEKDANVILHDANDFDMSLIIEQQQDIDSTTNNKPIFGAGWKNVKLLLGTSLAWFFLDIAYYGLQLNQTLALSALGYIKEESSPFEKLHANVVGNLILAVAGTFPGK